MLINQKPAADFCEIAFDIVLYLSKEKKTECKMYNCDECVRFDYRTTIKIKSNKTDEVSCFSPYLLVLSPFLTQPLHGSEHKVTCEEGGNTRKQRELFNFFDQLFFRKLQHTMDENAPPPSAEKTQRMTIRALKWSRIQARRHVR